MEKQAVKQEPFQELIQSPTPVLVDFYADWCGPCKVMTTVIQEVARELNGKARVIKINIDKSESAARQFNVQAVPTFIIFKNGSIVWRHSGMIDKQTLLRTVGNF
jgi:thioredoxin 1